MLRRWCRRTRVRIRGRRKIFVVGMNKTGTTSMDRALIDLGYLPADEWRFTTMFDRHLQGELPIDDILRECATAEHFQDIPFSTPRGFWREVYKKYPDARYILTVRDSAEVWFNSLCKFQSKTYKTDGLPGYEDFKNSYNGSGMALRLMEYIFGDSEYYDRDEYTEIYNNHVREITEFFDDKPNLLVVNVAEKDAYRKLCEFLGEEMKYEEFPWMNKTEAKGA